MRTAIPLTLLAFAMFLAPLPAHAGANQVANGSFDHDLSGWSMFSAATVDSSWSSAYDANNSSSSGSALLKDVDPASEGSNTFFMGLGQCRSASAGDTYHLEGATAILKGQSTTGGVGVVVLFYSATNCNGAEISNANGFANTFADNNWHTQFVNGVAPAGTQSVRVGLVIHKDQAGGEFDGYFDNIVYSAVHGSGSCVADATHLCLTGNRFRVSVVWYDYNNNNVAAAAQAVPFADETGFFYFKNSSNLELMVKVHDACTKPYYHYWFFAAATSDVGYTITVTDTQTGQTEHYSNSPHVLSPAVTDQTDFATCP